MSHEHRRDNIIYIDGEGLTSLIDRRYNAILRQPSCDPIKTTTMMQFNRIFQISDESTNPAELDAWKMKLTELGKAMRENGDGLNSPHPAGYTYLMQFINHDLEFNKRQGLQESELAKLDHDGINRQVYPSLVLNSVYGFGLQDPRIPYEGNKFQIGETSPYNQGRINIQQTFANDLPRQDSMARIANPLNDENLVLAQTHLAFLKFHNCLVDQLKKNVNYSWLSNSQLFEEVRKKVVQHFQAIVLYDALPRHIDDEVYHEVIGQGVRKFIYPNISSSPTNMSSHNTIPRSHLGIPVEFLMAAFRFGHSMVRAKYNLNDVLDTQFRDGGKLEYMFKFSSISGRFGSVSTLPSPWVLDWNRFYAFNDGHAGGHHPQLNFARAIDTNIIRELYRLPGPDREGKTLSSLAIRDLLICHTVQLATGQTVASEMGIEPFTQNPHAYSQLPKSQREALEKHHLKDAMPLWYYILAEATVTQQGRKLGTVGSRLVAETLHALIEASDPSILRPEGQGDWQSDLKKENVNTFSMVDLLQFVDQHSEQNEINPLSQLA